MKNDMTISYWNSTGNWRLNYYKTLPQKNKDVLTEVEIMEYSLDMAEIEAAYSILRNKKVHSVLDIGCGVGRQIIDFAKEFNDVHFWGVDISDYQIELMNNVVQDNKLLNVFPQVMDASKVDVLDIQFDLITMFNNSLGCISSKKRNKVILNVKKLLSKNGIFLFSSFDAFDMAEKCYDEWGIIPKAINYRDRIVDLGAYKSLWKSEEMILEEMRKLGYNLISKTGAGLGTVYLFNSGSITE